MKIADYRKAVAGQNGGSKYAHIKQEWWDNGAGKRFFLRSKWERNIACYLDYLVAHEAIKDWDYEADTYWFDGVKRGTNSYKPDFKVFNNDGSFEYWEVKGQMDSKSATKLKRMQKYHPSIKVVLIRAAEYAAIKKWAGLIAGWES
jgi:hypothetical protein